MKLTRFTLGARFDTLKDSFVPEDIEMILSEITSVLTAREVETLRIWGGRFDYGAGEGGGVYTVVFSNGSIKRMKNVYNKLNDDARVFSMLEARTPYLQNNVLRNAEGLEYFGMVDKDGVCRDGDGRELKFPSSVQPREKRGRKVILIAPNTFKGTIPGDVAAKHMMLAIRKRFPEITCVPVPAADGGDGTLDAIEKAVLGQKHGMEVTAPYGNKVRAEYYVVDGTKAMIESALASGLALCEGCTLDPITASSFGTGELILRAAHEGIRDIYVCLGGSATNDCGLGLARALGVRFLDAEGSEVESASGLADIVRIDDSELDPQVKQARITAVCDVQNPLTEKNGATYTFGPQKGGTKEQLDLLEKGMLNMETLLNDHAGRPVCSSEGAGAAGGMGAMLTALLGAKSVKGAEAVLELCGFDELLKNASLVITGEGRIDSTSLEGKAVGTIIEHAQKAGVPVYLIAGSRGEGAERVEAMVKHTEYSGSLEDALVHFDEAAERLIGKLAIIG